MDSFGVNEIRIPKMIKVISHRTGRFYYKPLEAYGPAAAALFETKGSAVSHDNPIVVTSVAAGVLGVILVIVLIFSMWIRRRCYRSFEEQQKLAYSASSIQSTTPPSSPLAMAKDNGRDNSTFMISVTDTSMIKAISSEESLKDASLNKVEVV